VITTIVELELRDDSERLDRIDLDRLTPRARAIAEALAATILRTRCSLLLESHKLVRDLSWYDPFWCGDGAEHHRTGYEHWAYYPTDSTMDPHDYLESEARKVPCGYRIIGASLISASGKGVSVSAYDLSEDHWLTRDLALELLRLLGRSVSISQWFEYASAPGRYVGQVPQWQERPAQSPRPTRPTRRAPRSGAGSPSQFSRRRSSSAGSSGGGGDAPPMRTRIRRGPAIRRKAPRLPYLISCRPPIAVTC
jgi:hypothetical protein